MTNAITRFKHLAILVPADAKSFHANARNKENEARKHNNVYHTIAALRQATLGILGRCTLLGRDNIN